MKILLTCPAPPRSLQGNRVTALRWARLLRELGHRPQVVQDYDGSPCDLLVALHARRSYPAIELYRSRFPDHPLVVALTGTDLYGDIRTDRHAQRSLDLAVRLIVLQALGAQALPARHRAKVRVLYQSVRPTPNVARKRSGFVVCVLGHLRPVKDPFRAALAARWLPQSSRLQILQAGRALSPELADRARTLMARYPRYRWLGELPHHRARRLLAASHLLVHSSRLEGGANVISEAVVDGVPVLASHIDGNVGLLGKGYPGYFPAGDTRALADLLRRAESKPDYYVQLTRWCQRLRPLFDPTREHTGWRKLLRELFP
jgi:putative glycosyltransferase (TIGR04348 family)